MDKKLISAAHRARKKAYAPYSHFLVGAALLAEDKIYYGCNVENASYGATVCAERIAFGSAIANGAKTFTAIAIVGGKSLPNLCFPCGICRQVMSELCAPDFQIFLEGKDGGIRSFTLSELLPHAFDFDLER